MDLCWRASSSLSLAASSCRYPHAAATEAIKALQRAGACPGVFIGGKAEGPKSDREWGWGFGGGGSNLIPPVGLLGSLGESRTAKDFPLFSAHRMASPDTIIFTLRAKLSGAVYCYRSCLLVCVCLFVGLLPR